MTVLVYSLISMVVILTILWIQAELSSRSWERLYQQSIDARRQLASKLVELETRISRLDEIICCRLSSDSKS